MMNVLEFGEALLESRDLDPIYDMLYTAQQNGVLDDCTLNRWLLAYWFFYNAGVASYLAEAEDFYRATLWAFDEKWPRGAERRHFRSANHRSAVKWFESCYPQPEKAASWVAFDRQPKPYFVATFAEVKQRVSRWPQFGDWITFKVADMIDRVMMCPVDFTGCALAMYSEPRKGALLAAKDLCFGASTDAELVRQAVRILTEKFSNYDAPPDYARPIGLQEVETILCKYKSYRNGHYSVGKDTREIQHSLLGRGKLASALSVELVKALPVLQV